MNDLQKMGGVAALIQAAAYVVGFGLALTLLAPVLDADPDQYGAFLVDNLTLMHIWQEKSVLRWGGLAGILGGIIFILVFALVIAFVGADPAQPEGDVMRFPDIRAARTVEDGLCLLVLILWVAHFLALYRALRETSLAPALFGSVLGIVGLGVLAAGALPRVATAPISDLYHAPGATPEDQATLVLMWQATEGIFDALFGVGLLLVPIGFIALGVAMLGPRPLARALAGERSARGNRGRSGICPTGRPALSERLCRRSGAHRLPSRRRMEALLSVEGSVGHLELGSRANENPVQAKFTPSARSSGPISQELPWGSVGPALCEAAENASSTSRGDKEAAPYT